MKLCKLLPLVLLSVVVTACGPAKKPLSIEARQSLKTVSITSEVEMPEDFWFNSKTQTVASNFGLIGALVGESSAESSKVAINQAMENHDVSIPQIVYSAFRNEMAKHTPFKPLKDGSDSDANMELTVFSYGFSAEGLSSKFRPILSVVAEMKNDEGDVIWRNKGTVTALTSDNNAKYTYEQMLTSPDVLREMIQSAANRAASNAMANL